MSISISSTTHERKAPYGKIFEFLLLDTLKMSLNKKFNPYMKKIRIFFRKIGHFFLIFKKGQERLLPTSFFAMYLDF